MRNSISTKLLLIFLVMVVVAFKFSVSSVFIQNAIERAELYTGVKLNLTPPETVIQSAAEETEQSSSMVHYIAHTTGLIHATSLLLEPTPFVSKIAPARANSFPKDAIPDSLFRPPRVAHLS
jgi:hypothetical protein